MGGFSGLFGTAGGAAGTGFDKPELAPVQQGTTVGDVQGAQGGVNNSLASQQALLAALQGQNGIGQQNNAQVVDTSLANQLQANNGAANQASAYNQTQGLASALAGNNGAGNAAGAMNQQQALNSQLGMANGVGAQMGALAGQGNLNSQLASANGVGAQAGALAGQGDLNAQLAAANGVGTQNAAISGLQNVAGQYQNIANGQGPNPAQAMLNQTTGQNIANQAALMAGQRGAGANVGLLARQAAQQGAGIQQNAVGQAATMEANQRLAGLAGLQGAQAAIGGLGTTQAGMQQAGIGQQAAIGAGLTGAQQAGIGQQAAIGANLTGQQQAGVNAQAAQAQQQIAAQQASQGMLASQASNQLAQQLAANQQQAALANQVAGQQIGVNTGILQGNLTNTAQQQGALGAYNNAITGAQGNVNSANAGLGSKEMEGQQGVIGGLMNAGGAGLKTATGGAPPGGPAAVAGGAQGGEVKKYAEGGATALTAPPSPAPAPTPSGAQSFFGKFLNGALTPPEPPKGEDPQTTSMGNSSLNKGVNNFAQGVGSAIKYAFKDDPKPAGGTGGTTSSGPAMVAEPLSKGGMPHDYRGGGGVKAKNASEKAVKNGDSYDNDKVKAVLSEGEVVIPRSVMQSGDPVRNSAAFVQKVLEKRKKG